MQLKQTTVYLVGVDCATKDKNIGVAFGVWTEDRVEVFEASACSKEEQAARRICSWLSARVIDGGVELGERPALLALDAPLGWPRSLSLALAQHRAGEPLEANANKMFRRETDRFIKEKTGKTALDVGADRIARTAHAALTLLKDIRDELKLEQIPLAWSSELSTSVSAIEVYPAATLIAHGFRSGGYKNPNQVDARVGIIEDLSDLMEFKGEVTGKMEASADALDAVVCLLAARDFLLGQAMAPVDRSTAEVEGWIWCGSPNS